MKTLEKCPYDFCEGGGIVVEGEFDNLIEKECLCTKE